jgi:mannosyltransferase
MSTRPSALQPAGRRRASRRVYRGVDGARLSTPASSGELRAVVGLTIVAAILRFYGLGHQGFWFDEANTALLVKFSPGKMIGLIPQTESTPPLYYCVVWVWSRIFGDHEAGLRSLSALCGVLTVPVAWAASRELVSRRAGVVVCALTACNPLLIWYSQEARSYELLVFLTALALLAFAYARESPSPAVVGTWVLACALALATHYYAVVSVAPQAVWLLWEHRERTEVRVGVGVVALCGLALVPLALSQNSTGHDAWIAHSPLGLRLGQILPQFVLGTGSPLRKPLKFAGFALALCGLVLVAVRADRDERDGALVAGFLAIGGFALSLAFIAAGSDALITRNIIGLWLPVAIVIATGLASVRAQTLGLAAAAGLCAIGLIAAIGVQSDYKLQRPDWRPVASALGPAPATGRLILIQHYRTLLPLSLYLPDLKFMRTPAASGVSEIDVISITSPSQPLCWWGAACNLIPSQMQARYALRGFREVSLRHVEQFTIMRLTSARPRTVSQREVARALVTTTLPRDELLIQRS